MSQFRGETALWPSVPDAVTECSHCDWLTADRDRAVMFELLRRGVFLNPMSTKLYLSLAHTEADFDKAWCLIQILFLGDSVEMVAATQEKLPPNQRG